MAKIATQQEAFNIGRTGAVSNSILCVTVTKAKELGCAVKDESSRVTNQLVPIDQLEENCPYVDLGLLSGTKWWKYNLGTDTPAGCGKYYAWASTIGYSPGSTYTKLTDREVVRSTLRTQGVLSVNLVTSAYDPAYLELHSKYGEDVHTPTLFLWEELFNYCTCSYITVGSINCRYLTSLINSKTLIIPHYYAMADGDTIGNPPNSNQDNSWFAYLSSTALPSIYMCPLGYKYNSDSTIKAAQSDALYGSDYKRNGRQVRPVKGNLTLKEDYITWCKVYSSSGYLISNGSTYNAGSLTAPYFYFHCNLETSTNRYYVDPSAYIYTGSDYSTVDTVIYCNWAYDSSVAYKFTVPKPDSGGKVKVEIGDNFSGYSWGNMWGMDDRPNGILKCYFYVLF